MHSDSYGMKPSPCTPECTEREMHCHTTCGRYKEWAAEREKRRAAYAEQRKAARRIEDYWAEFAIKSDKRRRK